jgi:Uma2 family endonuclease
VDCGAEAIEVHRDPEASGYRDTSRFAGAATVSPQAFPDVVLSLTEIFA